MQKKKKKNPQFVTIKLIDAKAIITVKDIVIVKDTKLTQVIICSIRIIPHT